MTDTSKFSHAALELARRSSLSRRGFLAGSAALGGLASLGLGARTANAATTMTWMGWQGYETPIKAGTFLKDNDIDFQPTFIASNEEIITKLQAGGIGKTDLITMYFGYLPLDGGGRVCSSRSSRRRSLSSAISFRNSPATTRSARTASSMACRGTGARCR